MIAKSPAITYARPVQSYTQQDSVLVMLKKLFLIMFLTNLSVGAWPTKGPLTTEVYKSSIEDLYLSVDFSQYDSLENFKPDATVTFAEDEWLQLAALARKPWTNERSQEILKVPSCLKVIESLNNPHTRTLKLEAPTQLPETIIDIDRYDTALTTVDFINGIKTASRTKDVPSIHCSIISTTPNIPTPLVECFKATLPSAPKSLTQQIVSAGLIIAAGVAALVLLGMSSNKKTTF